MFNFGNQRSQNRRIEADRRPRGPITIGFEQLEGREMLSSGIALTIIPTETRPLMSMPRPYVGSFNPEAPTIVSVTYRTEEPDNSDTTPHPTRFWSLGGRFRGRGIDLG